MRSRLFALFAFWLAMQYAHAQTIAPFKKGDRVVFVGNSITDGGHYHSYIWLYYMTRFPAQRIDVFNAGIGGDVAEQIFDRLDTDVFNRKPSVITLTFGMNDTGYGNFLLPDAAQVAEQKVRTAYSSFKKIERRLQDRPSIRKIMIASSPYDETAHIKSNLFKGKNAAILRIAAYQQQAAQANKWDFVDLNSPLVAFNLQEQKKDPTFTLCGQDRVHPTNDGQFAMAYSFLKAQGFANKPVAGVTINIAGKTIAKAENCEITQLSINADKVSFIYNAAALPYPIDTIARPGSGLPSKRRQSDALLVIPFIQEFNKEIFRVSGLMNMANYRLKIDGKDVGTWTGRNFAEGVNLAINTKTPQYQQALAVMALNEERWNLERRLREYYWLHYSILSKKGMLFNDSDSTLDSLNQYARKDFFVALVMDTYRVARLPEVRQGWQKQIDVLVDQIYAINQPKKRKIEIELVN